MSDMLDWDMSRRSVCHMSDLLLSLFGALFVAFRFFSGILFWSQALTSDPCCGTGSHFTYKRER